MSVPGRPSPYRGVSEGPLSEPRYRTARDRALAETECGMWGKLKEELWYESPVAPPPVREPVRLERVRCRSSPAYGVAAEVLVGIAAVGFIGLGWWMSSLLLGFTFAAPCIVYLALRGGAR